MRLIGTTTGARDVHAIDIAAGDLTATLFTQGAILRDVRLLRVDRNLTVGSDDLADYDGPMLYYGAIVAPMANRIHQARAEIDGVEHRFEPNGNGDILHSGLAGSNLKVWDVLEVEEASVLMGVVLPDGDGGFPGLRRVSVRFTILPPATLRMEILAATDAPTLFNAVNHSYWNLDGTPTWEGHTLRIAADAYLPVDDALIPSGEVRDVTGTPFDFREGRVTRPGEPPMDHNFCLSTGREPLREVLWLTGTSGVAMALATTEAGVQVYDGSQGARPGFALHEALAIEAQSWPDAPSHANFPSVLLRPGETYRQVTEWRFSRT